MGYFFVVGYCGVVGIGFEVFEDGIVFDDCVFYDEGIGGEVVIVFSVCDGGFEGFDD